VLLFVLNWLQDIRYIEERCYSFVLNWLQVIRYIEERCYSFVLNWLQVIRYIEGRCYSFVLNWLQVIRYTEERCYSFVLNWLQVTRYTKERCYSFVLFRTPHQINKLRSVVSTRSNLMNWLKVIDFGNWSRKRPPAPDAAMPGQLPFPAHLPAAANSLCILHVMKPLILLM
jgi:hypothetical protein